MYEIVTRGEGDVVATFDFDPYTFDLKQPNRDGLRTILTDMEDRKQMNRTPAPGVPDNSSGPEKYQGPSNQFLLSRIWKSVQPGHVVREVEEQGE